jgi:hypothetical protein
MLPATSATPSRPGQRRFTGSTGAWWARKVTGTGPWWQSTAGGGIGSPPCDNTPVHTADLPATPTRDRNIPATAWAEAPDALLSIGDDLPPGPDGDPPRIAYKRRLGPWLLWRAGPAKGADARYAAVDARELGRMFTFRLLPDGSGRGVGPSGATHERFRSWKEDLRDHH